jgi:hypothetical protein
VFRVWAKPELIVVCNARAADFFGVNRTEQGTNVWMGYDIRFDETCGLHRIRGLHPERINKELTHTQLENVPVCFTSTLKYMDKFSKRPIGVAVTFCPKGGLKPARGSFPSSLYSVCSIPPNFASKWALIQTLVNQAFS